MSATAQEGKIRLLSIPLLHNPHLLTALEGKLDIALEGLSLWNPMEIRVFGPGTRLFDGWWEPGKNVEESGIGGGKRHNVALVFQHLGLGAKDSVADFMSGDHTAVPKGVIGISVDASSNMLSSMAEREPWAETLAWDILAGAPQIKCSLAVLYGNALGAVSRSLEDKARMKIGEDFSRLGERNDFVFLGKTSVIRHIYPTLREGGAILAEGANAHALLEVVQANPAEFRFSRVDVVGLTAEEEMKALKAKADRRMPDENRIRVLSMADPREVTSTKAMIFRT